MGDELVAASMITNSINQFNKQSTRISIAMYILALAMFVLSAVNAWLIWTK